MVAILLVKIVSAAMYTLYITAGVAALGSPSACLQFCAALEDSECWPDAVRSHVAIASLKHTGDTRDKCVRVMRRYQLHSAAERLVLAVHLWGEALNPALDAADSLVKYPHWHPLLAWRMHQIIRDDPNALHQVRTAAVLRETGVFSRVALNGAVRLLDSEYMSVKLAGMKLLVQIGKPAKVALPKLKCLTKSDDIFLRSTASDAVRSLDR